MRSIASYSPLRVSFGGGGTDIPPFPDMYGGAVLNTTIDLGVRSSFINDGSQLELLSRDFVRSTTRVTAAGGLDGIMSVLKGFGVSRGRLRINGDVPPGSGLASSSAMMTSIALILIKLGKAGSTNASPGRIAKIAYSAERERLGVLLGLQDPYAIANGGFKFMEFLGERIRIERFANHQGFISDVMSRMLLVYTGMTRSSGEILGEQASSAAHGDKGTVSNLLKLKEVAFALRDSVVHEDMESFCVAINRGWLIKRKLGSAVSNKHVDSIIRRGFANGALAGRLLGGGSQGFVLLISKDGKMDNLQESMLGVSDLAFRAGLDPKGTRLVEFSKE